MDKIKNEAQQILDTSMQIFQIQEIVNPNTIFKNKRFKRGTEQNPDAISVRYDYENNDSSYFFETPEIVGVIIKRKNGNYCVKSRVKYYSTTTNQSFYFAKIRIEKTKYEGLQIMGSWGGSWEQEDYEDENLLQNPTLDLIEAINSMNKNLVNIYEHLSQNKEANNTLYEPDWVTKVKKYNN